MYIEVVESTFFLTMPNHPPRYLVMKNTMGRGKCYKIIQSLVILLTEKRLHDKFGTCNTFCKVKEVVIEAIP